MSDVAGYVVIEYNQASGQPSLARFEDLHDNLEDAQSALSTQIEGTRLTGRKETYAIGTVYIEEPSDD